MRISDWSSDVCSSDLRNSGMMCESCSGFGSKQSAQCMVRGLTPELSRPAATTVSVRRNTRPGGGAEAAKRVRLERVVMRIHALVTSRYDGPGIAVTAISRWREYVDICTTLVSQDRCTLICAQI